MLETARSLSGDVADYDGLVDETSAVEPLERTSEWEAGELPETYPWAV
jgi:hypothetical protein